jgi:hypothetical protein
VHILRMVYQRGSLADSSASNTFPRGIGRPYRSVVGRVHPVVCDAATCMGCTCHQAPMRPPHLAVPVLSRPRNRNAGGHKRCRSWRIGMSQSPSGFALRLASFSSIAERINLK